MFLIDISDRKLILVCALNRSSVHVPSSSLRRSEILPKMSENR